MYIQLPAKVTKRARKYCHVNFFMPSGNSPYREVPDNTFILCYHQECLHTFEDDLDSGAPTDEFFGVIGLYVYIFFLLKIQNQFYFIDLLIGIWRIQIERYILQERTNSTKAPTPHGWLIEWQ